MPQVCTGSQDLLDLGVGAGTVNGSKSVS